jgi:hypothetical protein
LQLRKTKQITEKKMESEVIKAENDRKLREMKTWSRYFCREPEKALIEEKQKMTK